MKNHLNVDDVVVVGTVNLVSGLVYQGLKWG